MIVTNETQENFPRLTKISIIDSNKVFYPLQYVLQKKDIAFNDDDALIIIPMPQDVKFPSSTKITDSGQLFNYKVDITINNQEPETTRKVDSFINKKVIAVLHYDEGKTIIGCNENPLQFLYNDDNSTNPIADNGFSVILSGTTYYLKVRL